MFDVHCHLEYMPNEVIEECRNLNFNAMTSVANPSDFDRSLILRQENSDTVFLSAGIHPTHVLEHSEAEILSYIKKIKQNEKYISAIGEIGLDYWHVTDKTNQELTEKVFKQFLDLAEELKKPVVLHVRSGLSRDAFHRVFEIIGNYNMSFLIHFFSGKNEELKHALEHGYMISINTVVCKSKSLKYIAKKIPMEHMVLETDSPWADPESNELINRPWKIEKSAEIVAMIKKLPKNQVLEATEKNARRFFDE